MKSLHVATTVAILALVTPSGPAFAQDAPRRVVHYGDLDLGTAAGMHTLHGRIEGALADVCGDRFEHDLSQRRVVNKCRAVAMAKVDPQIAAAVDSGRQVASTQMTASLVPH